MNNINPIIAVALIAFSYTCNGLQVIQGNSQEYIVTMEKLNRAEQLIKKATNLISEVHIDGYALPNVDLQNVLEKTTKIQKDLNLILRPDRLRANVYEADTSSDFILEGAKSMKYTEAFKD